MFRVSSMVILTQRCLMSKEIILWFSFISRFVRSFASLVELVTLKLLFNEMYWSNVLVKYLVNLYAVAVLLLITGRIGISVLCNFSLITV